MAYSKEKELTPKILWFAMLMSQGLYLAIPYLTDFQGEPEQDIEMMLYAFAGVSAMEAIAIPMLRRAFFWGRLKSLEEDQVMGAYFTTLILSLALAESIAIYGFVLTMLSHDMTYQWPFAAVGAAITLALFPNVKKAYMAWQQEQ